ncbi:MAG TPA: hypothetical protein PKM50_04440 [Methanoregula sp.]|nr:hypothetical protein [Methanoregula sp.]
MSVAGPAKRNDSPGLTTNEPDNSALYRSITRHSGTDSRTITPGPSPADKGHYQEETDPTETTEDESETIDPLEFEEKISAMTSLDRDAALRLASDLVIRLHQRTCTKRFREQDGDRTRVAYARVLVSALQTYGVLLRDDEIEQLKQRIEALELIKGESKP